MDLDAKRALDEFMTEVRKVLGPAPQERKPLPPVVAKKIVVRYTDPSFLIGKEPRSRLAERLQSAGLALKKSAEFLARFDEPEKLLDQDWQDIESLVELKNLGAMLGDMDRSMYRVKQFLRVAVKANKKRKLPV